MGSVSNVKIESEWVCMEISKANGDGTNTMNVKRLKTFQRKFSLFIFYLMRTLARWLAAPSGVRCSDPLFTTTRS